MISKEAIDFVVWYSGMTEEKVRNAYSRYLKEVKSIASDPIEARAVEGNKQGEKSHTHFHVPSKITFKGKIVAECACGHIKCM